MLKLGGDSGEEFTTDFLRQRPGGQVDLFKSVVVERDHRRHSRAGGITPVRQVAFSLFRRREPLSRQKEASLIALTRALTVD
jgi:hypothetical protein